MTQPDWPGLPAMRRAFDAAADSYDQAAVLQREVNQRLLERLELIRLQPEQVLDLGAATGDSTDALRRRYRKARVTALDLSPRMLQRARRRGSWRRPLRCVCADTHALPFRDSSMDLVFSSGMLHWCADAPGVFAEAQRVLRPGGLFLFATYGPDTLRELRQAWESVDQWDHVNRFTDMHDLGDAMVHAAFADPVMDMEQFTITYADVRGLLKDLRALGEGQVFGERRRGLLTPAALERLAQAYGAFAQADGRLPASWEVVYGHAWATERLIQHKDDAGAVTVSLDDFRRGVRLRS